MTIARLFLLFILLFSFSCSDEKRNETGNLPLPKPETDSITKMINEKAQLAVKYNAVQSYDSSIEFTYELQEEAFQRGRPLALSGTIVDIFQRDTIYVLKTLGAIANKICVAEIEVSKAQFEEFNIHAFRPSTNGIFIITPKDITARIPNKDYENQFLSHITILGELIDMELR